VGAEARFAADAIVKERAISPDELGARMHQEETYELFQRGRAHLQRGDNAQATVSLEKAKRREPDKESIREALGIAYFRIRRWSEAEAEFRKLLELSPVNDYAHYALGRSLEKQGRDAEANRHYKLASSLRPGSEQYRARIRALE
jgi:Flp pilus assembly protein TadD